MTFISILIALIIERFFHWSHLRHWQWYARYQHFLSTRLGNKSGYVLLVASVLPPIVLVGLISLLIHNWWYGIPKLIFGVIILLYCMGLKNLWVQAYSCIRSLNQDDPHTSIEQIKSAFGIIAVDQPQAFHQAFTRAIFIAANQRVFAVIFWFAVLGPWGAVLYRATSLCVNSNLGASPIFYRAQQILDWIPIRVFTFIFALGGQFTMVFEQWKKYLSSNIRANDTLLGECGIAALCVVHDKQLPEDGTSEKEALALLDRVFVISLVILAVVVILI